jgi:hypothetical protein
VRAAGLHAAGLHTQRQNQDPRGAHRAAGVLCAFESWNLRPPLRPVYGACRPPCGCDRMFTLDTHRHDNKIWLTTVTLSGSRAPLEDAPWEARAVTCGPDLRTGGDGEHDHTLCTQSTVRGRHSKSERHATRARARLPTPVHLECPTTSILRCGVPLPCPAVPARVHRLAAGAALRFWGLSLRGRTKGLISLEEPSPLTCNMHPL